MLVLLDDVGFGWPSVFGGLVEMPTAERLAGTGLTYNQFHRTALCSPPRVALLTGRKHHIVHSGVTGTLHKVRFDFGDGVELTTEERFAQFLSLD